MKIKKLICVILFLSCVFCFSEGFDLKIERTIGDEREDYTFFSISSAAVSKEKNIYAADRKGHFIAQYTWDGLFKKRVGQKGLGPGDFQWPTALNISGSKLYVFDRQNRRIVTLDKELNVLKHSKIKRKNHMFRYIYLTHDNRFVGDDSYIEKEKEIKKIKVIDIEGNVLHSFFGNIILKDKINDLNFRQFSMLMGYTYLKMGIDAERKKILVSFRVPKNPAEFFLYTTEGKLLKSFTYKLDAKYKFPINYILKPSEKPVYNSIRGIRSVLIYKEYFLVFLYSYEKGKESTVRGFYCILFDKDGKPVQKKLMCRDCRYIFYCVTEDGYLIGKKFDEDIEKLYIFKIHLPGS